MKPDKYHEGKAWLIAISIIVGVAVFLFLALESVPTMEKVNVGGFWSPVYENHQTTKLSLENQSAVALIIFSIVGLVVAFLYTILAAGAVYILKEARVWAYPGHDVPLQDDVVLFWATIWPLALLLGCIIYVFIGIINRIF